MNKRMLILNGITMVATIVLVMAGGCVKIIRPPMPVGERHVVERQWQGPVHSQTIDYDEEISDSGDYYVSLLPKPRMDNPQPIVEIQQPRVVPPYQIPREEIVIADPPENFDPSMQSVEPVTQVPQDGRSLPILAAETEEEETQVIPGVGKVGGAIPVITPAQSAQPVQPPAIQPEAMRTPIPMTPPPNMNIPGLMNTPANMMPAQTPVPTLQPAPPMVVPTVAPAETNFQPQP